MFKIKWAKNFNFKIGIPEHGWSEISIGFGSDLISFHASDVPADSLEMLANSICRILEGRDSETIFFLEPIEYLLEFKISGSKNVQLKLIRTGPHGSVKEREVIYSETVPKIVVSRKIYKSLRDNQKHFNDISWTHDYPVKAVDQIKVLLNNT